MGLNAWKIANTCFPNLKKLTQMHENKIANTCFSKPKLKKNKKLTMHGFFKEEQIEQGLSET